MDQYWETQRMSFGRAATRYDAVRPDWPAATADWLTGSTGRALDVLDLGAGTGKLTATLVAAGHRVTAADPSEDMLAVLSANLPGVPTVVARAEHLPLPDASLDVVTVAQAWHWVDHEAAAAECARVLRPGGLLAVAWHLRSPEAEPWTDELQALVEVTEYRLRQESLRRTAFELPAPFRELERTTFEYGLRLTPAGLAEVASTWSYVSVRDDRDEVLARVEALGHRVAGPDGTLVLPHTTYCYRAPR